MPRKRTLRDLYRVTDPIKATVKIRLINTTMCYLIEAPQGCRWCAFDALGHMVTDNETLSGSYKLGDREGRQFMLRDLIERIEQGVTRQKGVVV